MACLLIKNDGLGDLILASGLIADLARERGPLDLVTCAANREIAECVPGLRRIYYVSRDSLGYRPWPLRLGWRWVRSEAGDREVLRELAAQRYDLAVCLRRFIRQSSLILMRSVRAAERHCCWLYPTNATESLAREQSEGWTRHTGDEAGSELQYFRTFIERATGVRSDSGPWLRCLGGHAPRPEDGYVGLVISGHSTNWPERSWLELARGLSEAGCRLALLGGADAASLAARIAVIAPGAQNLVGRLGFAEAVPFLARTALVIGNDTGMTHFASMCAHRVLVILGGGTFGRFFPWPGATNQQVIFHGMDCFDCDWACKYPVRECLERVPVEAVLGEAQRLMAGGALTDRNLASARVRYPLGWRRGSGTGRWAEIPANESQGPAA